MNCSEVQELLSAYYDGELAEHDPSHVSDHLVGCSNCAKDLAAFETLSDMTNAVNTPIPPKQIWSQLERDLDQQLSAELPAAESEHRVRRRSVLALAATVLVTAGTGWVAFQSSLSHGNHDQFAAEFGQYLDEFRRDPETAQQILLTKYENQLVSPGAAIDRVGYRPIVAKGLPQGYTLASTHVMTMPCCTCFQSICKRKDGSTLAVFEHDDEGTTEWFGDRPDITARCSGTECCLVQLDDQMAASWKHGKRHITLIGVRNVEEVSRMVAWLDEKNRLTPN